MHNACSKGKYHIIKLDFIYVCVDVGIYIWCVCVHWVTHMVGPWTNKFESHWSWKRVRRSKKRDTRPLERFYCESWNHQDFTGVVLEGKILIRVKTLQKMSQESVEDTARSFLLLAQTSSSNPFLHFPSPEPAPGSWGALLSPTSTSWPASGALATCLSY